MILIKQILNSSFPFNRNNQLINFHDCLYEFRESTEFIIFPDWDELMIQPSAEQRPLVNVFRALEAKYPRAASFIYQRVEGQISTLGLFRQLLNGD